MDLKGLALCHFMIRGLSLLRSPIQLKGRFLSSSQARTSRCHSSPAVIPTRNQSCEQWSE